MYSIAGEDDVENLELVLQCMKSVKFSDLEIIYVLQIVVAILNLGNVEFVEQDKTTVDPASTEYLNNVKKYFQIKDSESLINCLTKRTIQVGKESYIEELSLELAYQARDTLVKNLYAEMFTWIIGKVNTAIAGDVGNESAAMARRRQ